MLPRPAGCDGDDCDHDEYGVWRHRAGCTSLDDTDRPDGEGWPAEYLDGFGRRPPIINRREGRDAA